MTVSSNDIVSHEDLGVFEFVAVGAVVVACATVKTCSAIFIQDIEGFGFCSIIWGASKCKKIVHIHFCDCHRPLSFFSLLRSTLPWALAFLATTFQPIVWLCVTWLIAVLASNPRFGLLNLFLLVNFALFWPPSMCCLIQQFLCIHHLWCNARILQWGTWLYHQVSSSLKKTPLMLHWCTWLP